ncbi:MAG: tetratricopeptide repeat protein, partial [Candidatus Electryoneaceae bacterium]|nr:tetratricopeptide repeat protein [Candidatus Electryoneaceae bacterium]
CAPAYKNLGMALIHREDLDAADLDAAVRACKKAIQLEPELGESYNSLGLVLNAKGDPEAAIIALRKSIKLNPALAEAYQNLGHAHTKFGDFDSAIKVLREGLEINPDSELLKDALQDLLSRRDNDNS